MIEEQISVWTLDIVHAGLQKNIRGLIKIWGGHAFNWPGRFFLQF